MCYRNFFSVGREDTPTNRTQCQYTKKTELDSQCDDYESCVIIDSLSTTATTTATTTSTTSNNNTTTSSTVTLLILHCTLCIQSICTIYNIPHITCCLYTSHYHCAVLLKYVYISLTHTRKYLSFRVGHLLQVLSHIYITLLLCLGLV